MDPLLAAIFMPFLMAALLPLMGTFETRWRAACGSLLALSLTVYFARQYIGITSHGISISIPWVPSLGVNLSLHADPLSLTFALLISGLGTLIFWYAGSYLAHDARATRLLVLLLVFMGSMLGVVLADNLIILFLFWELTSVSSYLLIGHSHEVEKARNSALQALLVTGGGGLALLFACILLGRAAGTFEISQILAAGATLREHANFPLIAFMLLIAVLTKSAQFPFHFWLPNAMTAPTPVSAYLHSATMVKAGIYLAARLTPLFGLSEPWSSGLMLCGAITFVVGAVNSVLASDLKQILASSTVSALGLMAFLLGDGSEVAITAAACTVVAHALYKGSLFLMVGSVEHGTGIRDIRLLSGLRQSMPWSSAGAILAALSMAGIPPFMGFVAKELSYSSVIRSNALLWMGVLAAALAAFSCLVAAALIMSSGIFLGRQSEQASEAHESPLALWLPPFLLAVCGLIAGTGVAMLAPVILLPTAGSISGMLPEKPLVLWHGFNQELFLSMASLAAGYVIYKLQPSTRLRHWGAVMARLGPERLYDAALAGLKFVARWQTQVLQNGSLRTYVLITVLFVISVLISSLGRPALTNSAWVPSRLIVSPHETAVLVIVIAGCVALCRSQSRLRAVASLGVVGFVVALYFILLSAPDPAITQFVIETLSVLIFILVLYRMPRFSQHSPLSARLRDLAVAGAFGLVMAGLLLQVSGRSLALRATPYFAENSYLLAHGKNVVNVILVDFRALDTLGEILVLAIAALGVRALLHARERKRQGEKFIASLILRVAIRLLLPLLLLFSFFLLVRGHYQPGGGFIGGLVASAGFALYALAFGVSKARRALRANPFYIIPFGLSLSACSMLPGVLSNSALMTGVWWFHQVPVIGAIGSPILFDIGVFLVVIGVTLGMLFELAER